MTKRLILLLLKRLVARTVSADTMRRMKYSCGQGCVGRYLGVVESGYFKYTTLTSSGNEAVVGFAFEGRL